MHKQLLDYFVVTEVERDKTGIQDYMKEIVISLFVRQKIQRSIVQLSENNPNTLQTESEENNHQLYALWTLNPRRHRLLYHVTCRM